MILGIDASNLRTGGSITHLIEMLRVAQPNKSGFSKVIVWSGRTTLARIDDKPWLVKSHQPLLDGPLAKRAFWQRFKLSRLTRDAKCDSLFVPGGSYAGDFHPIVTMSRNMLPFEWREMRRYGLSWMTLKLLLLRRTQSDSYRRADGIIFLTRYARTAVLDVIGKAKARIATVPHGIDGRFFLEPRPQLPISDYSPDRPFLILYVSTIDMYKHQDKVATAIASLASEGLPVSLILVGGAYGPALRSLRQTLVRVAAGTGVVDYRGPLPYAELHTTYAQADLCVFASSCENMPNTLLEGMASGLPIACAERGPMPEMLGDTGLYFDPEDPLSIASTVRRMIESPELRQSLAEKSSRYARAYSWHRCAGDTFSFIAEVTRHPTGADRTAPPRLPHDAGDLRGDCATKPVPTPTSGMKITVITVCFNSAATIADALRSVDEQTWPNIEHLVVDGGSTDDTLRIVAAHAKPWRHVTSAPDLGIYDAMNKGIRAATGDVIGLLNSDDFMASNDVLQQVSAALASSEVDACYGDLCYVSKNDPTKVIRYWRSSPFTPGLFARGWAPPHPTLYVRREIYERFGGFDLAYPIAADLDLMARFFEVHCVRSRYVPEVFVRMRTGGASNRSVFSIAKQNREIWHALRKHGLAGSMVAFVLRKLASRMKQFTARPGAE